MNKMNEIKRKRKGWSISDLFSVRILRKKKKNETAPHNFVSWYRGIEGREKIYF